MTLAQFLNLVQRRHNLPDSDETFWSPDEIYQLTTGRCNEILSVIGLLEATDTSNTSVAGTQAVSFPTDAVRIKQVDYAGVMLQEISFRDWQNQKNSGVAPTGTPDMWVNWNRQILLVPTPTVTADQITIYHEKEHAYIDGSAQTTIDIPSVLHWRLADGVLSDMYGKDLNQSMATFYENKWQGTHMPAFYRYAQRSKRGGRSRVVVDADSHQGFDTGVV